MFLGGDVNGVGDVLNKVMRANLWCRESTVDFKEKAMLHF